MNNKNLHKSRIPHLSLAAMIFAGASVSGGSFASDISHNVRSGTQQAGSSEDYLEIGLMHLMRDEPTFLGKGGSYTNTSLIVNGSYNWNNLFIESYSESGHGLVVGYNAFDNERWSLDFMVTTDWGEVSFEHDGRYFFDEDKLMAGGRLSGYIGDYIVQFALNQDATGDHNGTTASALIGRSWQYRNWNFHGIVGAEYVSAKLNDYYVGVSAEDAAALNDYYARVSAETRIDAYEADASVGFSSEFGVTYPISEDWVFRATARAVTVPDEISDSPYYGYKKSVLTSLRTSISYVF
ncbi:MipA/OmpV family protein [Thalassotalea sp. ND16A]|uniref:MipA/OmpV family protein n=1 Tax=Thalassotalea sp. ND16A TaxID=1535422 RepID=UPI000519F20D|nr:MipA/OmpV family protein [Thalassotalea sp. ND16A]KGJ92427.1 hypothetical protein ND16A_1605 [Thalassotalea sp. ND16A]